MNSYISIDANSQRSASTRGISLIELLIYLAIFSGIVFALLQIFIAFTVNRGQIEARVETQQSSRFAVETMTQAVHRATGVNDPVNPTLSLIMSDAAKNPTVFSVSSGLLNMREGIGTTTPLTSDLTTVGSLTFTKVTNTASVGTTAISIKIDFTLNYKNNQKPSLQYSQNAVTTAAIKQ